MFEPVTLMYWFFYFIRWRRQLPQLHKKSTILSKALWGKQFKKLKVLNKKQLRKVFDELDDIPRNVVSVILRKLYFQKNDNT
jgi:transcriptional regulator of heat shock response